MTIRKSSLLAATASVALLAIPPTGAFAFDVVDWEWQKLVDENVTIDITIEDNFDTTGMVEVEKLQMHFGDINATANIDGVHNNPPGLADGDGTFVFDELVRIETTYDDDLDPDGIDPAGPVNSNGVNVAIEGGFVDEGSDDIGVDIRVSGEVEFVLDGIVHDALDLPSVENAATAVANNQDITSTVPVYLHDAQIAAGDINAVDGFDDNGDDPNALGFLLGAYLLTTVDDELEGLNAHTDIAALTIIGAATGFVESADISATANVRDILNATVDNSATAVTNNMSVTLAALNPNDAVMIADITQVGIADVTADANVQNCFGECGDPAVEINNYANLRALEGPIVSNTATAVGNNLNINVSGPAGGVVVDP